jgi:geranylgeranyl diphosphate synthase type II
MRTADELRDAVEAYVAALELSPDLGALEDAVRYALEPGGKRIRPVLCLAVTEAAGGDVDAALPAAVAVELVHTFSLVHDDLPSLDDDDERRGRPSAHVAFGDGVALLAGDALLAEAFRLALAYDDPGVARELVDATLGMIGGQHRDVTGDDTDLVAVERLKTGRLFRAAVQLGLRVAGADGGGTEDVWLRFADELGPLFQIVDDLLDEDGLASQLGPEGARALADAAAERALEALGELTADTSVLEELVESLLARRS